MRLMLRYLKRHLGLCLLNIFLVTGFVLIELGLPYLFAKMINNGILAANKHYIWQVMGLMFLITIIGTILNLLLAVNVAKITTKIVREIREDLFHTIQKYSHAEYEEIGVASLITRLTNDAYQIMLFLNTVLRIGMIAPIMFGASIYLVVKTNISLSMYVLIALPILVLLVVFIGIKSEPLSIKQQHNLDGINQIMRENLTGIRVIRAFARENFESERFEVANKNYQKSSERLFLLMAINQPAFNLIFLTVITIILWFGAKQISIGALEVGNYMAVIEYIFHSMFSLMLFANIFVMYPRANVSAKRIEEADQLFLSLADQGKLLAVKQVEKLEFDDVSFKYPNSSKAILTDISFSVNKGETVAFIGSTGSGKSSLLQLIPRFYDVTTGSIKINGCNVQDYQLSELRKMMGYVPQKAILFDGTVADNLRFGKEDASETEMWEALAVAQSQDFIAEKNGQLVAEVAEGGTNFSGGQRQRLAIARALIRQPKIYLFDDSFSALDFKTDAKLRQALKEYTKEEAITLIVAQRVSTIMNADKIIVLDNGRIAAVGNHEELLATSALYNDIAKSQLSEEELG